MKNLIERLSLSVWRAWIEMEYEAKHRGFTSVALRMESVDRNEYAYGDEVTTWVALRMESVDRNMEVFGRNYL